MRLVSLFALTFLFGAVAAAPRDKAGVAETDIATLQGRMSSGGVSSRELTRAYLERIAALDDAGPTLNSVIELNPDALKEADARDAERKAGKIRGPLHGVPILLKDNIDATPMVNSAGSLALANHRPKTDAFLVGKLRDGRRGDSRQDQSQRVGELPFRAFGFRLERARRTNEESLRARPQSVRIELRHGHGDRREPGGGGHRHGDRRQHHLSVFSRRPGGHQADRRSRQPQRHHSHLAQSGHRWPDDAQRCGRRRVAQRNRRSR